MLGEGGNILGWGWVIPGHSTLCMKPCNIFSLIPRPSHVFQRTWEKSGRPGQFGDVVMITYLPQFVEMVVDTSSSHHQIDQAFPRFLMVYCPATIIFYTCIMFEPRKCWSAPFKCDKFFLFWMCINPRLTCIWSIYMYINYFTSYYTIIGKCTYTISL